MPYLSKASAWRANLDDLTALRDQRIVDMYTAQGMKPKQIAGAVGLSVTYVHSILRQHGFRRWSRGKNNSENYAKHPAVHAVITDPWRLFVSLPPPKHL